MCLKRPQCKPMHIEGYEEVIGSSDSFYQSEDHRYMIPTIFCCTCILLPVHIC
uniref:Uncharacterized protein n=1 Tax=Arundo donax TaxID=35708 RepID=A0A0A9BGH5_ARUDO